MSKMVEINKRKNIDLSMGANKDNLAIDNVNDVMVTSLPPTGAGVRISNCNSLNLVKSLVQIMYERGEINSRTYENAMKKVSREAEKYVSKK